MSPFNDSSFAADRSLLSGAWQPRQCIAGLAAATVLFASWIAPVSRAWWDALDHAVFSALNPSLANPGLWQSFWAVANWRPFDLVAAAIIFSFVLSWLRAEHADRVRSGLASFLAFCLLLLLGKACEHLLLDFTGYRRASPTLVFPDAVRLSEIVAWISVKDRGSTTFPGDHAFVIFATAGFLWICAGRNKGILALLALVPFTLPRVVAGAHWMTDILVGGGTMALLLLSLGYATPFAGRLACCIDRYAAPLLDSAIRIGRKLRMLH
jgi:membrane-associated phospholipid phosphatase